MYAEVLVEYSNKAIDKTFTYIIPLKLKDILKEGMRVLVPFNNKLINGIVIKIKNNFEDDYQLKEIDSIIDSNIYLNKELIKIGKFIKDKTLCSSIVAYQTILPTSLKIKKQLHNYDKIVKYLKLNKDNRIIDEYISTHERNKAQINILELLRNNDNVKYSDVSNSALKKLVELDLVKIIEQQVYRLQNNNIIENDLELTKEQEKVVNNIDLRSSDTYLLYGITGSGKTEVYIHLIKKVIKNKKKCLLLVPEITLTTQMINRFYSRFGSKVAVFHSGLSNGERYDEYLKIYRNEIDIVVGTRSAIFAPLKNIGLIIIDEEHSQTYHQENNPRYDAKDVALFRSVYNKCPLILGSATPSLESMARAKKGVYKLLTLSKRINNKLPYIKIVDMKQEMKNRRTIISLELENKIRERLAKKEQIILLLNRRGYSTIITCQNCGYTYKCPHCDITLTYHKTNKTLRCHYCGYTKMLDNKCPKCQEQSLNYLGMGTEKLESYLMNMFNDAKIVRMDVDTTTKKGAHEKIINDFKEHKYDILLGTQMISKGLDFPLVTLVGVINADSSFNLPDFRSGERTFSLLHQVAGRSGRSELEGEVIIQSYDKDNYYLKCVLNNNYEDFYKYEMNKRRLLKYPPYYYITLINIKAKDYQLAKVEANKVYNNLKQYLLNETIILGPNPANPFKLNNIYCYQIIIKYKYDSFIDSTLSNIDKIYANNKNVSFEVDMNPLMV